jgi:hypothetical protein
MEQTRAEAHTAAVWLHNVSLDTASKSRKMAEAQESAQPPRLTVRVLVEVDA